MADFRRWIIVLAVVALFAGLASAQVGSGGTGTQQLTCTANTSTGAVTPTMRQEGYTELVGDVVVSCSGGTLLAPGTQIPQADLAVTLSGTITSRLLSSTTGASEIILLIDEPQSGLSAPVAGFGPAAPQVASTCSPTLTGSTCLQYAQQVTAGGQTYAVATSSATVPTNGPSPAPNVFQGFVSGSTVTFYGVPVLPPGTTAVSRVFRITNMRVNASAITTSVNNVIPVFASVSGNPNQSLPITSSQLTVGFIAPSLTAKSTASTLLQCQGSQTTPALAASLQFKELIGTAFKTRVLPFTNTLGAAESTGVNQIIPGGSYTALANAGNFLVNSESGLVFGGFTNGANVAGLADFGTRLKAMFYNIPAGVSVYVTATNTDAAPAVVGGQSTTPWAVYVPSETAPEAAVSLAPVGNVSLGAGTNNGIQIPIVNGIGEAVWEITNSSIGLDTLNFGVYVTYTYTPATATTAATPSGTGLAYLGYAPSPNTTAPLPALGFSATFGTSNPGVASATLAIPRFTDPTISVTVVSLTPCRTVLLWPYVTTVSGFDTGLAIANTTSDPFGTKPQAGTCTLYFYGGAYAANGLGILSASITPAPTYVTTTAIPTGTVWAASASSLVTGTSALTGFNLGYVIGVCNFQFAHGYGAITDTGVRNFLGSYLALILDNTEDSAISVGLPVRGTSNGGVPLAEEQAH